MFITQGLILDNHVSYFAPENVVTNMAFVAFGLDSIQCLRPAFTIGKVLQLIHCVEPRSGSR